ncbi:MAG: hypothetical protein VB084_02225 [Syntrophomonadaceae bacterium]|nr:hypothetical protein [Syntrophomonadaceae bacterium]
MYTLTHRLIGETDREYRNEKRLMKTDISFGLNVAAAVALTMAASFNAKWLQLAV